LKLYLFLLMKMKAFATTTAVVAVLVLISASVATEDAFKSITERRKSKNIFLKLLFPIFEFIF
jgi:hypothetical protein